MPVIPFASFLAGAIISLVMPAGLLVAFVIWYHLAVRRFPGPVRRTPRGASPENPSVGNRTTANPSSAGQPAPGDPGPAGSSPSSS
jgi:hypothetical protein